MTGNGLRWLAGLALGCVWVCGACAAEEPLPEAPPPALPEQVATLLAAGRTNDTLRMLEAVWTDEADERRADALALLLRTLHAAGRRTDAEALALSDAARQAGLTGMAEQALAAAAGAEGAWAGHAEWVLGLAPGILPEDAHAAALSRALPAFWFDQRTNDFLRAIDVSLAVLPPAVAAGVVRDGAAFLQHGEVAGALEQVMARLAAHAQPGDPLDLLVVDLRLRTFCDARKWGEAADLLLERDRELGEGTVEGYWRSILRGAAQEGQDEQIAVWVRLRPDWTGMALVARLDARLGSASPDAARELLLAEGRILTDAELAPRAQRLLTACRRAGKLAEAAEAAEALLGWTERPRTVVAAARAWVGAAQDAGAYGEALDRLETLRANALPPAVLFGGFTELFYHLAAEPNGALLPRAIAFGEALRGALDVHDGEQLENLLLDAAFLGADFPRALDIVDNRLQQLEPEQRAFMRNKILAHQALQEGRMDEAVRRFRTFMDTIAAREDTIMDPVRGVRIQKAEILGVNARRIGELLARSGNAEAAQAAFAEARGHYEAAIAASDGQPAEAERLTAELQALPR